DATEQSRALDVMAGVAKHDPDRLAQILQPHVHRAECPGWLRRFVRFANVHESRPIFELLLDAVRSRIYEGAEHELWLSTHDLAQHQPAWAVELLTAHLVDRPGAMSLDADGKVAALLDRDHSVISLAQQGARGAPQTFCETIIPYMLRVMAATAYESKHDRPLLDK